VSAEFKTFVREKLAERRLTPLRIEGVSVVTNPLTPEGSVVYLDAADEYNFTGGDELQCREEEFAELQARPELRALRAEMVREVRALLSERAS
jgi:hypothetical protein